MNPIDDNPDSQHPNQPLEGTAPGDLHTHPPEPLPPLPDSSVTAPTESVVRSGDPLSLAPSPSAPFTSFLPEDLRISWSWIHLLFFGMFALGSILCIQVALVIYYATGRHMTQKELEQLFQSKPEVAVGSNVLWFFLIFLFLYVTLAAVRGRPFWPTLGWKKLSATTDAPSNPWVYFAGGIGLAILVAIASSRIKTPDHLPIQDLFKSRTGALWLMGMAVLVAPLVEETVFRGYLYPLFASTISRIAKSFGVDPAGAVRFGTVLGILFTGTLFGILHGAQLGWTWGLVAMLSTVGVVFTFARARAGTVVASFLLHLGYNSMIAFSAIFATKGFTQLPPHP